MAYRATNPHTYESTDSAAIAQVHDFLDAHERTRDAAIEPRSLLVGSRPGEQIELPEEVYQILRQVVTAMRQGMSVTVSPVSKTLTTQQAAQLLNVSRPTVVKLLENGSMPFEKVGSHRRIKLHDVIDYQSRKQAEQYDAIAALGDYSDEEPLEDVLASLRTARATVAARHKEHGSVQN